MPEHNQETPETGLKKRAEKFEVYKKSLQKLNFKEKDILALNTFFVRRISQDLRTLKIYFLIIFWAAVLWGFVKLVMLTS